MAKLVNTTIEEIRALDGLGLFSQQILQHGAIHALEHLLAIGVTEENVRSMLSDLRNTLVEVERLAATKGVKLDVKHEHRANGAKR